MPLKIYRRGEIWHFSGTVAGRRLRGSTKTADKETAKQIAADRESREWKGSLYGPETVLTFAQAAIMYLAADKPDRFIPRVSAYWKDTPVKQITGGAVRQSAIVLLPKAKAATRNRNVIVPTQAIINHAAGLGQCQHLKVERFAVVAKKKQPATWNWVQHFMAVSSPHLGALACFMLLTGARITEALDVRWKDVALAAARVTIRQGKIGGEERIAHMPPALVAAVANIPGEREPWDKVFVYSTAHTAKWPWRAAIKRAGIAPLTFHSCRHGFATAMLHSGVDPITTAKLGGWKDPRHVFTTYGHAMDDDTLANRIIAEPQPREQSTEANKHAKTKA